MKMRTIKLSDGHAPKAAPAEHTEAAWKLASRYRVEQITDSIEYSTGQMLDRSEVERLVHSQDWKVTIVSNRASK